MLHLYLGLDKIQIVKNSIIFLIFIVLLNAGYVSGQNDWKKIKMHINQTVCFASDSIEKSYIPPPKEFFMKSGQNKSDFIVTYSLFPSDGKAKAAFEYAVSIWEQIIESDIPIHIDANWRTMSDNILGSAGPTDYFSNFEHAPRKNRFYPVSVVEKITKTEINGSTQADIDATFNKDIKWYFGTDGNTPDQLYDFVTVVLHEIGHGLGFTGFFFVTGKNGAYGNSAGGNAGDATAFDIMVINQENEYLTDTFTFEMPSVMLYDAFTSNNLFIRNSSSILNNSSINPRLYAPVTWNNGSSIYHLNDETYPFTNENSLMTHAIGKGEAVHDPGPVTSGILADIGWKHMKLKLDKPKDIEEKKPITFNLSIESDYKIETNKVFVFYSTDSFNKTDSMLLIQNETTGLFSATLNPSIESGKIDYYIKAGDKMNRTFSLPNEAPSEFYSVLIGTDYIPPVINHKPIPYFFTTTNDIKVSTQADDNLGIDTVYIEFAINNVPQQSFGLTHDSTSFYSGTFKTDSKLLSDGDVITYKIIAIDSSGSKNKTINPVDNYFSFKIEKVFNPIGGYINDFNSSSPDFIISDFEIYTENGFTNGSLHSPHPYPSPNENNKNLNFTTFLKYPIILQEGGTISFDEIVLVEPGEVLSKFGDEDFWDYVIVEGSKDKGKTWLPIADGYDSGANTLWKTNYNKNINLEQVSNTVGIPDWYLNREINILENGNFSPNDTILIRFRLYSDPYAHGWGWTIDNLRIQFPVSNRAVVLSPGNISVYPNPVNEILTVSINPKNYIEDLSVELINPFGQKIFSIQKINVSGEVNLENDMSSLPAGMYFVVVKENGTTVISKKVIKN